jgi:hypothetical protein
MYARNWSWTATRTAACASSARLDFAPAASPLAPATAPPARADVRCARAGHRVCRVWRVCGRGGRKTETENPQAVDDVVYTIHIIILADRPESGTPFNETGSVRP